MMRTLAVALLVLLAPSGLAAATAPRLELAPCEPPGLKQARCGRYEVWEDRARRSGRKIGLKVVVVPATGPDRQPDPFVFLNGGPGESATAAAAGLAHAFAKILARRDFLLVDQRGTGGSNPLDCTLYGPELQSFLGDFFPAETTRRCRPELEAKADLSLYTTSIAMDDLEEVRVALGYPALNLFGGSYGTRASLEFMRRHPGSVRTATLHGVAPPSFPMPLNFARDAQRALDGVLAVCAAEPGCAAAFPSLPAEAKAVIATLERGPVRTEILDPQSGEATTVALSRDLAAEAIRYLLYQSGSASMIPVVVHQAAQGDFGPLAEFAAFGRRAIVSSGATGMYLSVTCAEDLPRIAPGEGERLAAGTFLADYRLRQQRRACEIWPAMSPAAGFAEPVASQAPTLLLSGEWDPVTPPSQAEAALRHLPQGRHLVVRSGGHSFEGLLGVECVTGLMTTFVEAGSAEGLDTGCLSGIKRPPFPTSLPPLKPVPVAEADLAKLAGRYVGEGGAPVATIEAAAGKLRVHVGDDSFLLVPVAPARFRLVGSLSAFLAFELDAGRGSRAVLEEGGIAGLTLKRADEAP
jgi:pimeloyl-ACP methyl ester carboxylesterase